MSSSAAAPAPPPPVRPAYLTDVDGVTALPEATRHELQPVVEKYVFRSNSYYQSLIDWTDPADPIRRIVVPVAGELEDWGALDASDEHRYTAVPGVEHKYADTALLLVNNVCAAYCRFCFRKRLFMDGNDEAVRDVTGGVEYIRAHPEISNVLLTGGDPLLISPARLEAILRPLLTIDHVRVIRIGTKMPAFNPARILDDPAWPRLVDLVVGTGRALFVMVHYNHPAELTPTSTSALRLLGRSGATLLNQTPMIRGLNDEVEALAQLFSELTYRGVCTYYVFQCRPTAGNKPYSVPIEEGFRRFRAAQERCSGLASSARFVMSHATGKIEVLTVVNGFVHMRYHRAARACDVGRHLIVKSDPHAYWLDDYRVEPEAPPSLPVAIPEPTAC